MREFGFLRYVGGVRDISSDANGRQRRQTVSGGAGGGMGDNGRRERGQSETAQAAE